MGNDIEAEVILILRDVPDFITYEEEIETKGCRVVNVIPKNIKIRNDEKYDFICRTLRILEYRVHHDRKIFTTSLRNRTVKPSCLTDADWRKSRFILVMNYCSKHTERKDLFLSLIEELKPYLIANHPNILGTCKDEDGYKENNFTICLDSERLKAYISENKVICEGCNTFNDMQICDNIDLCRRAFERGKQVRR